MRIDPDLNTRSHVARSMLPRLADEADSLVLRCLKAIRRHLGLRIAYISEFVDEHAVLREVDAPGFDHLAKVGDRLQLSDIYCQHILEGRLPELLPDASSHALAKNIPVTAAIPIGAHVSVPIRLTDGSVYGMFCCLDPAADPTLSARDLQTVRAFAELVAEEISDQVSASKDRAEKNRSLEELLRSNTLKMVFQPIWNVNRSAPVGFEALARFPDASVRSPQAWFAEAAELDRSIELELYAISLALGDLPAIPAPLYLSVNASPRTVMDRRLRRCLAQTSLSRIVLEITEHSCFDDLGALSSALAPLRRRGLRIAVDDAGAGYTSLQEILKLSPDIIKLDRVIVQDVTSNPSSRALVKALVSFTRETNSMLVAEGVETADEFAALNDLGVDLMQGYLFGKPDRLF